MHFRFNWVAGTLLAIALVVSLSARPAPAASDTPTPTPTPSSLPIGTVNVDVTNPGSQPTGATHVEQPPIR